MGFDPWNHSLKIQKFNSQSGSSLGSVRVHSLTLSYTFENMSYNSRVSLLARTLASPCFGHEPKTKVATNFHIHKSTVHVAYKQLTNVSYTYMVMVSSSKLSMLDSNKTFLDGKINQKNKLYANH
jgi:hypothetical protein